PWLQDTPDQQVWDRWGITYRDVAILDAFNRPLATANLTSHDLDNPQNREVLVNALLQAATPADTDSDGLPDVWETHWFNNLEARPDADDDGDGADNFNEFTLGSDPADPASRPLLVPHIASPAGVDVLGVTFRRFAGSAARVIVETSSDLVTWTSEPTQIHLIGNARNLADGTGTSEVRYQLTT